MNERNIVALSCIHSYKLKSHHLVLTLLFYRRSNSALYLTVLFCWETPGGVSTVPPPQGLACTVSRAPSISTSLSRKPKGLDTKGAVHSIF